MVPGWATGQFGQWLREELEKPGRSPQCELFYDHGDSATDPHVAAIKGFAGETVSNRNRLADIDVMLATPEQEVQLLIEIEERPLSPKKLLGDIFALLFCNQVAVRQDNQQRYFLITPQTHLIVAGIVPAPGQQRAKIEDVILPRVRHTTAPLGSIPPHNLTLVLGDTLEDAIERLKVHMATWIA
jgi:hypothetical protein